MDRRREMARMSMDQTYPYSTPALVSGEPYPWDTAHAAFAAMDRPASLTRKFIEFLFYLVMTNTILISASGRNPVPFLSGGLIALGGVLTLFIMLTQRERLPVVFWAGLVMVIGGSISDAASTGAMMFIGDNVRFLVLWTAASLMAFYLVQNEATMKRMVLFYCVITLTGVAMTGFSLTEARAKDRLGLENVLSGTLADPNSLSYMSGLLTVFMLFWSLRARKLLRPLLWVLAALLTLVLLRTVSRSGIVVLMAGLAVFVAAVMMGRGVRASGIVVVLAGMVGAIVVLSVASSSLEYFESRMHEHSIRQDVYRWETVEQLVETIAIGYGVKARTAVGIAAHNSFIQTHLAYGGITAYPYAAMLFIMWWRTAKFVRRKDLPLDSRFMVLAVMGMTFSFQMFSNYGYSYPESVFAMVIVCRYTQPQPGADRELQRVLDSAAAYGYPVTAPPAVHA
jgi:hypothetical protein